jgi:GNAT superfamily N-acetyltransferase
VTKGYRIRRVEDADPVIDLRSMFRNVLGMRPAPRQEPQPDGCLCFAAIADHRMVGSITLRKPERPAGDDSDWQAHVATVERLDVDPGHLAFGCREALLDVALQWARASEYDTLEVAVPAAPASAADFYLARGFHIVGGVHEPTAQTMNIVLSLRLSDAKPHTDAWYSKHHGAWFASMSRQ